MKPRDAGGASTSVIRRSATCRPAEPEARLGANTGACLYTQQSHGLHTNTHHGHAHVHTENTGRSEAHGYSDTRARTHVRRSTQTVAIRGDRHTNPAVHLPAPAQRFPSLCPRSSPGQSPSRSSLPQIPLDPQFDPLSGASPGFRGWAGGWSCGGDSGGYCGKTRGAGLHRVGVGSEPVGSCRGQALESPSLSWSAAVLRPWMLCHQGCYSRAPAPLRSGFCSGAAAALSSALPPGGRAAPSA